VKSWMKIEHRTLMSYIKPCYAMYEHSVSFCLRSKNCFCSIILQFSLENCSAKAEEFLHYFSSFLRHVKAKDAICNPVVMSVLLSVCNRNAWNAWDKEIIGRAG